MATFVTGTTGYLGSYIAHELLTQHNEKLALLVRAKDEEHARHRLWKSLQMHLDFETFERYLYGNIDIYLGDLTQPDLGLSSSDKARLIKSMDSVIHCAASLNRKSSKSCFNVNLRGTLEVIKLARAAHEQHGLRRFSDISTVAVCGKRKNAVVKADEMVDWSLSDFDPYARTKKFCEHMLHELLPDVTCTVFRPSIILGDSRFPETTQFDMVRAFTFLATLPALPLRPEWLIDIVPANYVGRAVVTVHQKDKPLYSEYNLSSGVDSLTYREVVTALAAQRNRRPSMFLPALEGPFTALVNALADTPREWGIALPASLMKVFMPYLVFNTVFDNSRIVEELGGEKPVPFNHYCYDLLQFATNGGFKYPYQPWPDVARHRKIAL